jgi:lysophospholipase L1-like esterase
VNALWSSGRRTALAVIFLATMTGGFVVVRESTETHPRAWPLTIAVVGDSFTAGRNNQVVWPTLLAQRTGWSVANFAQSDAGFAVDEQGGHAFSYQVQRAEQVHPRAIMIMTGVADADSPFTDAVAESAADAIGKIKLSGVQGLVVGPTWYGADIPQSISTVSEAVRKAADDAGVPFLNALDPPWLTADQMQADLGGVTDKGQSVIADKVAAWLRTELAG